MYMTYFLGFGILVFVWQVQSYSISDLMIQVINFGVLFLSSFPQVNNNFLSVGNANKEIAVIFSYPIFMKIAW